MNRFILVIEIGLEVAWHGNQNRLSKIGLGNVTSEK